MAKLKPDTTADHARTPKSMRSTMKLSEVKSISRSSLRINNSNADYFRKEDDAYFERLTEDVKRRGFLVPLIAKKDGTLLAGHNRLTVAERLGIDFLPVQYVELPLTKEEEREFVIKDNLLRRHLSANEWIEVYKKLYPDFEDTFLNEETRTKSGRLKNGEERLTIAKIAADVGQKEVTVKAQIRREREKNTQGAKPEKGYNVSFSNSKNSDTTKAVSKIADDREERDEKGYNVSFSKKEKTYVRNVEMLAQEFNELGSEAQKEIRKHLKKIIKE